MVGGSLSGLLAGLATVQAILADVRHPRGRRPFSVADAIEEIPVIAICTEQEEWANQVRHLPI
jgi:hypothetical protein